MIISLLSDTTLLRLLTRLGRHLCDSAVRAYKANPRDIKGYSDAQVETIWVLRHFAFLSADEQWESISKGTSPSPTCIPLLVKSRWFDSNHPGKCLRWGSEWKVWALWRLMFSRRIVAEKGDPALLFFYNGSTEKGWRGWTLNGGATKQHLLNHRWL